MKLCDAKKKQKKQCNKYRDIQKAHCSEINFEDFEVFHRVFLQQLYATLILSVDLFRSSEEIVDRKRVVFLGIPFTFFLTVLKNKTTFN